MPELPEVETTRRGIEPHVAGRRVVELAVHEPRLRWPVPPQISRAVRGAAVIGVRRRAKYLLIDLDRHRSLILHLGMSGSLRVLPAKTPRLKHDHFDLLIDRPEAVEALEQTILQLAVRGLLVPQDPTDEPASVLLQKIRTEKNHLIAQGKIKRDKPLPPITDEEKPFELPKGWEWMRLGGLANFIDYRGKTPTKTTEGVPLITAKNVRQGFINREPREYIAESAYDGWMTRGFPKVGDLLFTTEAPLGNVAAIDIQERFALAQRVICFGLYELQMSGTLCTFMQSPWMQDALSDQATGVTAQGIKSARLQLMLIPVPPLEEQSRIVTRVNELRALCADLRQRLLDQQTKQSHLADALVAVG